MNLYRFGQLRQLLAPEPGDPPVSGGGGGGGGDKAPKTDPPADKPEPKEEPKLDPKPADKPAPKPAPEPKGDDEIARLRAEVDRLSRKADADAKAARRQFVRSLPGYSAKLSDANLDRLLPEADVQTTEGQAALMAWRKDNGELFEAPTEAPHADVTKLATEIGIKGSVLFGPESARNVLTDFHRGDR